jgi:hypothetical protein
MTNSGSRGDAMLALGQNHARHAEAAIVTCQAD